ncbi:MAG: GNAT family N-acetyltransferase [Clostridiales bacterium]|nr:GNAT family N-acetyltransferase [Clostridiales bacterium]
MNLNIAKITEQSKEIGMINELYISAFPNKERRPLMPLLQDHTGHGEVLAFWDENTFCGFACLLNCGEISHIIYFAIEEELRGKGYGTAVLSAIAERKAGKRIIVDIEAENKQGVDYSKRHKRKRFYLHNGFLETNVAYEWRNESYEILSRGGFLSMEEFKNFWNQIYSSSECLQIY